MLLVPTSMTTAIYLGDGWFAFWPLMEAAAYVVLVTYAYCCWEMLLSRVSGFRPTASRWTWLFVAGALLVAALVLSTLTPWPVTFNAGTDNWVSTSWGSVVGEYCLPAFEICALGLAVLRAVDAVALGKAVGWAQLTWRLLALVIALGCGVILALNAMLLTSDLQNIALAAVLGLTVCGVGSLAAFVAVRHVRGGEANGALGTSA